MAVLKSVQKSVQSGDRREKRKRAISVGGNAGEAPKKPLIALSKKKPKVTPSKSASFEKVMGKTSDAKPEKPLDRKGRKELAEFRKKKRKPNYDLEKEVKILWEKMRDRKTEKEARAKLVSETLKKMKSKLVAMGSSHIASRVLQACLKYCTQEERAAVFEELRPHTLALARNTYAYHLVIKMLDHATKPQLQQMISSLHGQVVSLLRHPVGSAVVEHAYQSANGAQKRELLCEFYSPEYRLFKGITGNAGISDLFAKESSSKQNAMLQHMMLSLQPILEKGIIDHSITHRVLVEYMSVCKKSMVEDVVKSLAGPLLVRMIHTRDGAKVGVTCVKLSTVKERKKIVTGMKGHVSKIAQDEYSSIVLLAIFDTVDDTKLISKVIIGEILKDLKDLASHKYGRRCILHLLAPGVPRYFPQDVLEVSQHSTGANLQDRVLIPAGETPTTREAADKSVDDKFDEGDPGGNDDDTSKEVRGISKKDPGVRRLELLSAGGLGTKLTEVCTEHAYDLLQSSIGTDLMFEVAMGGLEGVLWEVTPAGVLSVHRAIANLASQPPVTDAVGEEKVEHVLEQYHASRTIRRLILSSEHSPVAPDSPSFANTLWDVALQNKCKRWAKGHSAKVISAYRLCADSTAKVAAENEVQKLIDTGVLKQT